MKEIDFRVCWNCLESFDLILLEGTLPPLGAIAGAGLLPGFPCLPVPDDMGPIPV